MEGNVEKKGMGAWRWAALACVLMVSVGLFGCDDDDEAPGALTETSTLAIREIDRRLIDAEGREWTFRGINARIEGIFDVTFDDGRIPLQFIPAFEEEDARLMARYGYNFLRLPINWSGIEPQEGQFSEEYLARVDRVIDLCAKYGIYVLVDFHQDAYSKHIGEDGAPLWAIIPPPDQLLEGPLEDLEQRRISGQVLRAFKGFFENQESIRDRFLPAWRLVVERYKGNTAVAGFQPMNEPVTFHFSPDYALLYDFYDDVAEVMTEVGSPHALWVEPDSVRNFTNTAPLKDTPLNYPQVVYCPHLYPFSSTAGTFEEWVADLRPSLEGMREEADSWDAALVMGEWGGRPDDPATFPYFEAVQSLTEELTFGHALWLWKEDSQGRWGYFDRNPDTGGWIVRPDAVRELGLPMVMASPGRWVSTDFDRATSALTHVFEAQGGEGAPLVYLPEAWYPNGAMVTLNGEAVSVSVDPLTQRALLPWEGQAGTFTLQVTSQ